MNLGIRGKCALVTGGSHGIGRAIALALADEGCNVAICARRLDLVLQTAEEIKARGVLSIGLKADVLVREEIESVMDSIAAGWGTIHILVNNAGGGGRWGARGFEGTSEKAWLEVYDKNALAAIRFTSKAIASMRKQRWGRVVTIGSIHGREGGGRPWFSMAKAAEIALMKTLAMNPEYQKDNITFNTVAPGPIWIPDKEQDQYEKYGSPEDVASAVIFLCSEQAKWINGACLVVDGGEGRGF